MLLLLLPLTTANFFIYFVNKSKEINSYFHFNDFACDLMKPLPPPLPSIHQQLFYWEREIFLFQCSLKSGYTKPLTTSQYSRAFVAYSFSSYLCAKWSCRKHIFKYRPLILVSLLFLALHETIKIWMHTGHRAYTCN